MLCSNRYPLEHRMLSKLSELRLGPWFRRNVFWFAVGVVALALWANRYRYDSMALGKGTSFPVRINRLTGTSEVLYHDGWKTLGLKRSKPRTKPPNW